MLLRTLFFSTLIALFLVGCRKSKATWGSDWVVPLFNDTLFIDKLVNDSTLQINDDNSLQLRLDRTIASFDIFDRIKVPDTTISQSFVLSLDQLPVPPGVTYVNEVEEHEFELGDVVLKRARLKSGIAEITVENPVETMAIFTVELPGVTKNGATFKQVENVPPKVNGVPGKKTFELSLAGYQLDLRGESGSDFNVLQSKMLVRSDPNGNDVVLTNEDVVQFKVKFKNLSFDYAKGFFGQLSLSDTTVVSLDALERVVSGKLNLEEVSLKLILENGIKAMAQGNFTHVKSRDKKGEEVSLTHPSLNTTFNINPAQGTYNDLQISQKKIHFDGENSSIIPFVEHLGNEYEIGYKVTLNPWGNTSGATDELFPQSKISLRLISDFPLMVSTENLVLRDTFEIDMSSEQNVLRIEKGEFVLDVENAFPYGSMFQLMLLNEDKESIGVINASSEVAASSQLTQNNEHIPTVDEVIFPIDEEIAKKMSEVSYLVVQADLSSATTTQNQVYANAFIGVKLKGVFRLKTEL